MRTKKEKPKYNVFQNTLYTLKESSAFSTTMITAIILSTLLGTVVPLFTIYLPKIAIDVIVSNKGIFQMMIPILGFTLIYVVITYVQRYMTILRYWYNNSLRNELTYKLFLKTLYCDYANIESHEGQKSYQKSKNAISNGDWSGIGKIIPAICGLSTGILGFIIYSGILSSLSIIIVVGLLITSTINFFVLKYARNYEYKNITDVSADINNKLVYIENAAYDEEGGKDIRLFSMKNWFVSMKNTWLKRMLKLYSKSRSIYMISSFTDVFMIFLRDGLAYLYLIILVSRGDVSIASFVLYFGAIAGFSNWFNSIINQTHELSRASLLICDMREFLELDDAEETDDYLDIPTSKEGMKIEFRDVCFSYGEEHTIDHLNLTIEKGEKVAFVGLNGAGKTTIVKLLCGFYKVDSGEILIDGININRFRRDDLFELFSAVFQEVFILPFTVADNVSFMEHKNTDRQRVEECLQKAGLLEDIMRFEDGIDSVMDKLSSEKGILLSGGQKQKLLLARALYKKAQILILDEPTAALDPIAESNLYNQYKSLTHNKTSIFISHRLASTSFCDKIAFLSKGKITELGTHEQLISQKKEYYKLFEIQSHYYNEHESQREAV